jgi:tetratricopeptide (TPR) repeat protein
MKKLILSFAVAGIITVSTVKAQYLSAFNNLTAYQSTGNTDVESLKKAQQAIDVAIADERSSIQGKTWYYRGLIYQLVYENKELSATNSDALIKASESYQKAFNVGDTKFKQTKESYENLITCSVQLYNRGIDQYQNKQYKEALLHFKEVASIKSFLSKQGVQNNVDDNNSLFNAALAALKLDDNANAKEILSKLIDNNYDSPAIYTTLSNIYLNEGNDAKAKEVLEKGTLRYPENVDIVISQLNLYLKEGKANEVLDKMIKASELDSKNASLLLAIGVTYYELKDVVKAEEYYNKAIEKNPNYFEAYNNLGQIYLEKANAYIEKMNDPKITDVKYKEFEKEREKHLKTSLPYLEKAAEIKPNSKEIFLVLKEVYAKLGDYEKSKQMKLKFESIK